MKALFFVVLISNALMASTELSWRQCLEETSNNNYSVKSSKESLKASESSVRASYGSFLPQVNFSLGYNYGENYSSSSTGNSKNNYNATLSISQNIFNGLYDYAGTKKLRAGVELSKSSLDSAIAQVSYDLKSKYADLIYAQSAVKLYEDIIRRREDNLRLVQLKFESGRENKGSALLSVAYLNQAKYESTIAKNDVDIARVNLARVLGRKDVDDVNVSDKVPITEPPVSPDLKELVLETPEYRQAIAQESMAESLITQARSGFFPTLSLNGVYAKQGETWYPNDERWYVGLTLSVPLFNGGRDYYSTKGAAAGYRSAVFSREDLTRSLLSKLKSAYNDHVEAVEKLKVDESFLKALLVRAEIARKKYSNGLLSFEDFDNIENDLINRQKAVLNSRRDRIVKEAAWLQALGKGDLI